MATFLLVHGAWHGGWCWRRVANLLRGAGHDVHTPTLTGLGERAHLLSRDITLETHVQDILGTLTYEDLQDVVLVGHSYGGTVITAVAERAAERLSHLVYLDAFVPGHGQSQADLIAPELMAVFHQQVQRDGDGYKLVSLTAEQFGVRDEADLAWVRPRLGVHPLQTKLDPVYQTDPDAAALPRTYIYCSDPAIGPFDQFAERVRNDPRWRFRQLATGHDAMITAPAQLAELLLEAARVGGARPAPGIADRHAVHEHLAREGERPRMQPLQDLYPDDFAHCYGCGRLNAHGLHVKSTWQDGEAVARFDPEPWHIALPGFVYGGLIASLIDCHAMATAAAASMAAAGETPGIDPTPRFVTASLHVDFLRPTPLGPTLVVRGRAAELGERKVVADVTLTAAGDECARGRVVAVRMPAAMRDGTTAGSRAGAATPPPPGRDERLDAETVT